MQTKILTYILVCFSCSTAIARWATPEDAEIKVLMDKAEIQVKADGTYETIAEYKVKILNEAGRQLWSKIPLVYNYDSSTVQIISAKTIVDGQEHVLDANLIEDKPLASEVDGFDQKHQILLAFPYTKVGSELYLKYKEVLKKPNMQGFYENKSIFGLNNFQEHSELHIKSELQLYINSNDPKQYLNIKSGKTSKFFTLDVTLLKPVYNKIVDETLQLFGPNKCPWVAVSSSNDWKTFGNKTAAPYIKVLQQPLPELYMQIYNEAKKESDPIKQITIVTSMLNKCVQYMGDWKSTEGSFKPQDLTKVATTRLGDCKDFSTGTAAILNKLGIKATVALVWRGEASYKQDMTLPAWGYFNHAMVKVSLASGPLWVDPTNFFSIATKILPDIADRDALVLDSKNTVIEHIPASKPADFVVTNSRDLDLTNPELIKIHGTKVVTGLAATHYTGAILLSSKNTIENSIIREQGSFDNITNPKVNMPNLDSRIVSDLKFSFEFNEKNLVLNTNAGKAILSKSDLVNSFIVNDEQVSDLYLGSPAILSGITTLSKISPTNILPLDCTVQSPWLDAKRTVKYEKNSVTIKQEFTIKRSWIYNYELKSTEYKKMLDALAKNFKEGAGIVFTSLVS